MICRGPDSRAPPSTIYSIKLVHMKPLREFYIPSVHDGTRLSCRIYQPDGLDYQQQPVIKGAVVAHPYATLGGNNDDPTVLSIAAELVRNGYVVTTLNFRGAGTSGRTTSWTAKAEMGDYVSAYGFMLKYCQLLAPSNPVELLLAGYSYGSMIASHQPSVEDVKAIFLKPEANSSAARIIAKAKQVASGEEAQVNEDEEFYDTDRIVGVSEEDSELPQATISFLLVSPILSFISGFVRLWGDLSKLWIRNRQIVTPTPDERLPKHRTLVVYGTDDMFTGDKKLQTWTQQLKDAAESQVSVTEVFMAGHFWIEQSFHQKLRKAIGDWLNQLQ